MEAFAFSQGTVSLKESFTGFFTFSFFLNSLKLTGNIYIEIVKKFAELFKFRRFLSCMTLAIERCAAERKRSKKSRASVPLGLSPLPSLLHACPYKVCASTTACFPSIISLEKQVDLFSHV
jgi:hypothetical protein